MSSFNYYNSQIHISRPYVFSAADPNAKGINVLGYKGSIPSMPRPNDEIRIIMLGGSTVFGKEPWYGDELGIPELLEENLFRKYKKKIKVYNFGITATVSKQELVRLLIDVVDYNPHLVISYGGGNDVLSEDRRIGYPHFFELYESNPLWSKDIKNYPTLELLMSGSLLLRKFFKNFLEENLVRKYEQNIFEDYNLYAYKGEQQNYISSLVKMDKISKSFGFDFISFFQPLREFSNKDKHDSREWKWRALLTRELDQLDYPLDFHDLSKSLVSFPASTWEDSIHVDLAANKYITSLIEERIDQYILKYLDKVNE